MLTAFCCVLLLNGRAWPRSGKPPWTSQTARAKVDCSGTQACLETVPNLWRSEASQVRPKSEGRSSKAEGNPNAEFRITQCAGYQVDRPIKPFSGFGLLSTFTSEERRVG